MVITLNGKKYECPVCYEELKTRHWQRMKSPEWEPEKPLLERDAFKLFCILTDSEFKTFHATSENEVTIWNAVKWVYDQPFEFTSDVPPYLQIGEKIISVPKDMRALSIGQNIHLRQVLDSLQYLEEGLSMAAAIYLQPVYDESKFNYEKAVELEKQIREMPAYLIRPIGFFLLRNAVESGKKPMNFLKRIQHNLSEILRRTWLIWLSGNGLHLIRMLVW